MPATLHGTEDRLLEAVSGRNLMDTTAAIAQWIRLSGDPDEAHSFDWIERKVQEYGFGTTRLAHEAFISLPGEARLEVDGESEPIGCIAHAFAVSTPPEGTHGELVFVAPDEPAPEVHGRIVLTPGMANGVTATRFEELGAIAQIHIQDDQLHETSVSPVWGNPTDLTQDRMPTLPGIAIRRSDGERLRRRLSEGAVTVTLHARVLTEWRSIPLLIADLPGVDAETFLMLSTHVDSWYYGAMDNGSANATALEVARLVAENRSELRRGLRLCFWSGHSHGRFAGSAYYADLAWHELHERCIANVFVDSTGGLDAVIVTEPPVMPQTHGLAAAAVEKVTGETFAGKRIGRFADQSFYGVGLNSVFGTLSEQDAEKTRDAVGFKTGGKRAGGLGWWWHTPHDTVDKVDEANLVRDTRVYLVAVWRLLTDPVLPFDYRPAIGELVETTSALANDVGDRLDLGLLERALERAREAVEGFQEAVSRAGEAGADIANDALLRISRHLVPIAFHENGRYEHDPAAPLRPMPALQDARRLCSLPTGSAEAFGLATRMRRAMNWIVDELDQATRVAEAATDALSRSGRSDA